VSVLDSLDSRYRLILCDIWGVIHDGIRLYPGAEKRLHQWRREGRCIGLITNAPRTQQAVEQQLDGFGLARDAYQFVATSGEAGIEALTTLGRAVGFLGTAADRAILEGRGVVIADGNDFSDLACTGMKEGSPDASDYSADLNRWAERGVTMHCLNPDRVVMRGKVREACAGAIADLYEGLGGKVIWYGKPHDAIYAHTLHRAGNPPREAVLAIGDGLQTDMLGAARQGFDAVFVTGGIHEGEPFPHNFAAVHGLNDWQPLGVVEGLD
jgi:HAD superfamily hydrolase (TIGR01459 family)